jgi:hypothetical protein
MITSETESKDSGNSKMQILTMKNKEEKIQEASVNQTTRYNYSDKKNGEKSRKRNEELEKPIEVPIHTVTKDSSPRKNSKSFTNYVPQTRGRKSINFAVRKNITIYSTSTENHCRTQAE